MVMLSYAAEEEKFPLNSSMENIDEHPFGKDTSIVQLEFPEAHFDTIHSAKEI